MSELEAQRSAGQGPRIVLYSDNRETRELIRAGVGRKLPGQQAEIEWVEVATPEVLVDTADAGGNDLLILDGEAGKAGGMGMSRQLKDEIYNCPPVLLVIGRPSDAWLASWSFADAVVSHPIDPLEIRREVAKTLSGERPVVDRAITN